MDNIRVILENLRNSIESNAALLNEIATKLEEIELGGGGGDGNATIEDYAVGKRYKRNTLLVYEETVYRVLMDYESQGFDIDYHGTGEPGSVKLKLVGFESSIVTYGTEPSQEEVNALPQDTLVAIYSSTDDPYNLT